MAITYFFPNTTDEYLVFTEEPSQWVKEKIDKWCRYSEWNSSLLAEGKEVEFSSKLHGYIKDGKCYDNSYIFYDQSLAEQEKMIQQERKKYDSWKEKVDKASSILTDVYNRIDKYRECKNTLKKKEDLLEKGYVKLNVKVNGSKRMRRFKKNSDIRDLTSLEIKRLKEEVIELEKQKPILKEEIKSEKAIEDVFFALGNTIKKMREQAKLFNGIYHEYGETIVRLNIFEEDLMKFKPELYKEALKKFKEVLRIDEEEKTQKVRVTKNKTRTYIDENGVEHTIEDVSKEQSVKAH